MAQHITDTTRLGGAVSDHLKDLEKLGQRKPAIYTDVRTLLTLHFAAKTMTCLGDKEANLMFTRPYRQPFVVPEKV